MDAFTVQVVIDSRAPHELAEWWAETLRWRVEPQDEDFIRSMIDQGHATEAETMRHHGSLVWREGAAIHPASESDAPRLRVLFQLVPEDKSVKNRMHLDIRTGDADRAAVRESLIARGATALHEGRQGPLTWVTMADPEGNEFCV